MRGYIRQFLIGAIIGSVVGLVEGGILLLNTQIPFTVLDVFMLQIVNVLIFGFIISIIHFAKGSANQNIDNGNVQRASQSSEWEFVVEQEKQS
jgi:hypothetical protein